LTSGLSTQILRIGKLLEFTKRDPLSLEIIASLDYLRKKTADPIQDLTQRTRRILPEQIEINAEISEILGLT
jgi:hypothetical protein